MADLAQRGGFCKGSEAPARCEIRPLEREQVRALFKAVSGHQLEALYNVAVTAGLRQGGLLGLR